MKSKLLNLNIKDLLKGFVMAILTAIVGFIYPFVEAMANSGEMPIIDKSFIFKALAIGIGGGLMYLFKNFITNSEDKILKSEKKLK